MVEGDLVGLGGLVHGAGGGLRAGIEGGLGPSSVGSRGGGLARG